jgi:Secretion system C-terminal sorting domain
LENDEQWRSIYGTIYSHKYSREYRNQSYQSKSYLFSPIRSVHVESKQNPNFKIYPNPTSDKLTIEFTSERPQLVDFELFDTNGKLVYAYKLHSKAGNNHLSFDTSQFPKGLYSLKIKQGTVVSLEKIVIQ